MNKIIYNLNNLIKTQIIPRPEKSNRSPFLLYLNNSINDNNICHSKAQKCNGLLIPNKYLYVTEHILSNKKQKKEPISKFIAQLAILNEEKEINEINKKHETYTELVCINPDIAEHIFKELILHNYLIDLGIKIKNDSLKSQITITHKYKNDDILHKSRFDFTAININNNKTMIFEIKTVVLADYENDTEKVEKLKIKNKIYNSKKFNEKIAIFPKGFRARKSDTISPRAI